MVNSRDFNIGTFNAEPTPEGGSSNIFSFDTLTVAVTDTPTLYITCSDTLIASPQTDEVIGLSMACQSYDSLLMAGGTLESADHVAASLTLSDSLFLSSASIDDTPDYFVKTTYDDLTPRADDYTERSFLSTDESVLVAISDLVGQRPVFSADSVSVQVSEITQREFGALDTLAVAPELDGEEITEYLTASDNLTVVISDEQITKTLYAYDSVSVGETGIGLAAVATTVTDALLISSPSLDATPDYFIKTAIDTLSPTVSDAIDLQNVVMRADLLYGQVDESRLELTDALTVYIRCNDQLAVQATDLATGRTLLAADDLSVTITEGPCSGVKSAADSALPTITEATQRTFVSTDSLSTVVTDYPIKEFTVTESVLVAITDATTRTFVSTDSLLATVTEGELTTTKILVDTLQVAVDDYSPYQYAYAYDDLLLNVTEVTERRFVCTDSIDVTADGSIIVNTVNAPAYDSLTLATGLFDGSPDHFGKTSTDSLAVTISELVTQSNKQASDSLLPTVTDATQREFVAVEDLVLTADGAVTVRTKGSFDTLTPRLDEATIRTFASADTLSPNLVDNPIKEFGTADEIRTAISEVTTRTFMREDSDLVALAEVVITTKINTDTLAVFGPVDQQGEYFTKYSQDSLTTASPDTISLSLKRNYDDLLTRADDAGVRSFVNSDDVLVTVSEITIRSFTDLDQVTVATDDATSRAFLNTDSLTPKVTDEPTKEFGTADSISIAVDEATIRQFRSVDTTLVAIADIALPTKINTDSLSVFGPVDTIGDYFSKFTADSLSTQVTDSVHHVLKVNVDTLLPRVADLDVREFINEDSVAIALTEADERRFGNEDSVILISPELVIDTSVSAFGEDTLQARTDDTGSKTFYRDDVITLDPAMDGALPLLKEEADSLALTISEATIRSFTNEDALAVEPGLDQENLIETWAGYDDLALSITELSTIATGVASADTIYTGPLNEETTRTFISTDNLATKTDVLENEWHDDDDLITPALDEVVTLTGYSTAIDGAPVTIGELSITVARILRTDALDIGIVVPERSIKTFYSFDILKPMVPERYPIKYSRRHGFNRQYFNRLGDIPTTFTTHDLRPMVTEASKRTFMCTDSLAVRVSDRITVLHVTGHFVEVIWTDGDFTWTVPMGVNSIDVDLAGAGGGAGTGGDGDGDTGGEGGYGGGAGVTASADSIPVVPGTVMHGHVGSGGRGGCP